jgi:hypothetical protein
MYNKIDSESSDCASSGLDLFFVPGTNVGVINVTYKEFLTLNPVASSPYLFSIPPTQQLIDLGLTTIESVWSMHKSSDSGVTWANIVAADHISTVQMFGAVWIRNVKLSASGREISNSNNLHAYKVIFDTLLNYDLPAKETHLAMAGFYPDDTNTLSTTAKGFESRRARFEDNKRAQFVHNLDLDLFNQPRYFINNVPLEIEIHPNTTEFLTLAPNFDPTHRTRFVLHSLKLKVAFPTLSDSMMVSLNATLERRPAIYPIRKTELKTVYLEQGRTELNVNIFTDIAPRFITMGMVTTPSYNGTYTTNPFNFKPFGIMRHHVEINGVRYPSVENDMNFADGEYAVAYYETMRNCGYAFSNASCGITMEQFREGHTIFTWDLTANAKNDTCFELMRKGTTSYHVRFREGIPAGGMTMIFKGEFDSIIKIDRNRQVTSDLTV